MGTDAETRDRSGIEGTLDSPASGPDTARWEVNVHESGKISVSISDGSSAAHVTGNRDQINLFAAALITAVRTSVRLQADR